MAGTGNTPRSKQLGAEIKRAREAAGVGFRDCARKLGIDHAQLGHWESGRRLPSVEDLASLLGAIGINGETREHLIGLAQHAAEPDWVTPGVDRQLAALIEWERIGELIFDANNSLIPGNLQTGRYMRAIMSGAGGTPAQVEQRALIRLGRREVLDRVNPVRFEAVIGEQAVRYPPCDRATALDQLQYLQKVTARRDNITVQVVPFESGYTPLIEGNFVLIEFGDGTQPVVQSESLGFTTTITDREAIVRYRTAAESLRRAAMSPEDSSRLIAEIIDGMERMT